MLYRGKRREKPDNRAIIIVAAAVSLSVAVCLIAVLSNRKIPKNTDMTMAAAALPTTSAERATESVLQATSTVVPLATVTEKEEISSEKTEDSAEKSEATSGGKVKTVGIVNASDVNMREKPTDGAIITTLAKGTVVVILDEKEGWSEVVYKDTTGYVSGRLLEEKNKADLNCTGKITADALNVRAFPSSSSSIICQAGGGAYVDVTGFENGWFAVTTNYGSGYVRAEYLEVGVEKPAVNTPAVSAETSSETSAEADSAAKTTTSSTYSGTGADLAATAQQYLGYSYSYGGAGPGSFDCSGFTMYIYGLYGVSLPHGATDQYGYGTAVSQSELQPGDLVFFSYQGYAIGHVGIYIGDRNFIHASTYGVGVIISSLDSGSYPSRYVGARRIF